MFAMRKIFFAIVMSLLATGILNATELVRFDLNNFQDWDYTRPGFTMTQQNVGANKVDLFKSNNGVDYTLVSPLIEKAGVDTIVVNVLSYSKFYQNDRYNAYKGSPTIEILDENDNVLLSVFKQFENAAFERRFSELFVVKDLNVTKFKVRLACWEADSYCCLAVKEVVIENVNGHITGDVNSDGFVTSSDITALYDYLLTGNQTFVAMSDVNGDGAVTSADVTSIYDILLGQ